MEKYSEFRFVKIFLLGFIGKSFAVGDQKVRIKSILKYNYKLPTFWNTNSGGTPTAAEKKIPV